MTKRCHICGAPAEVGFSVGDDERWLCTTHMQCVGCGPEAAGEDHYPTIESDDDEEVRS